MKTYHYPHPLIAVLPSKGHLKRILACILTLGVSVVLLANTAPSNSIVIDTNRTAPGVADQNINKLPITPAAGISGVTGSDEFSLPLVMTAFKAVLNDKKVMLNWTTGIEKRLSHFVVERSTNGIEYKEAGIMFAVVTASVKQNYSFSDPISVFGKGMLYYRIRIVDVNGRFQNSAVKVIRVGDANSPLQIETYPNPVVSEVRITIPAKWQNKQVKYEVYNTTGRIVRSFISTSANQTEVVNMNDCYAGLYVIKASTISEAYTQTIFKK